jgi:hypothetical protein
MSLQWSQGMNQRHSEAAFETVIAAQLLANGYVALNRDGFDRERAIFPYLPSSARPSRRSGPG